ncbi:MAG TPA: hypothetical protein VMT12_08005 [Syntrophales bacterium]|nr:hypothetical protein [Syntrophales bacterium]
MGIINLEDIQVDMILACDVKERSGRVLLAEGSKITEKHLKVFKMWGITEADIKGIEKEELTATMIAQLDQNLFREVEIQTRERFCHVDMEHPFIKELFHLLTLRQFRRRSKGQNDV